MEYSKIKKSLKKFGLNFNNKIIKAIEDIHKNEGDSGGITVALNCPIINPYTDELYHTFDVAGLSEQINYYINAKEYSVLRKYFSHLNAAIEYISDDCIDIYFDYTWDNGDYFGAFAQLSRAIDAETGDIRLDVVVEGIDLQADRYTSDFETIIEPLLRGVLGELTPAKVLKIGKNSLL